jgi:hypothetical protein
MIAELGQGSLDAIDYGLQLVRILGAGLWELRHDEYRGGVITVWRSTPEVGAVLRIVVEPLRYSVVFVHSFCDALLARLDAISVYLCVVLSIMIRDVSILT